MVVPNGRARRERVGRELARARQYLANVARTAKDTACQDARDGVPEALIARELGVSRMTIRKWLGK